MDTHLRKRFPSIALTRWQYHSELVETAWIQRKNWESSCIYNRVTRRIACRNNFFCTGTSLSSKEFQFQFYAQNIFFNFFKILQTKRSNIFFCNTRIDGFRYHMQKLRWRFGHLRSEMENAFDSNGPTWPKRICIDSINGEERKYSHKWLFCEIIDVLCQNVSVTFSENSNLLFLRRIELNYKQ
jgi:hypothetical protein